MNDATAVFSVHNEKDNEIRMILKEVYDAGFNC